MRNRTIKHNKDDRQKTKVPAFESGWISDSITDQTIEYAESLGLRLKEENFTSSQFRNFYGELKRIQLSGITKNKTSFLLLKPKLAYAAARSKKDSRKAGSGASLFKKHIFKMIEQVKLEENEYERRFKNFCDLVEAVLAFHKAAEESITISK